MDDAETAAVVARVIGRLEEHDGTEPGLFADAVTADPQSVNGDLHLRLVHHSDELPQEAPGDNSQEYAALGR